MTYDLWCMIRKSRKLYSGSGFDTSTWGHQASAISELKSKDLCTKTAKTAKNSKKKTETTHRMLLDFIGLKMTAPRFYAHLCKKISRDVYSQSVFAYFLWKFRVWFCGPFQIFHEKCTFPENVHVLCVFSYT